MKKMKKLLSIVLIAVMTLSCISSDVSAASYPNLFFYSDADFDDLIVSDEAYVGDTVEIRMEWWAAYNNEGYEMIVYDSNGIAVARDSDTFTNIDYKRHFTISWDTTGYEPGRYTVEVTKSFYSLYRWNEAPTKDHLYITLKARESSSSSSSSKRVRLGKVKGLTVKNDKGKAITVKYKKVNNAKKYKIQYALNKKFTKSVENKTIKGTKITIKKLEKGKKYYVRVRALNGKKSGKWSSVKKIKIRK